MQRNLILLILFFISYSLLSGFNVVFASSANTKMEYLTIKEPHTRVNFDSGVTLDFTIGLGSGAFHYADDPDNIVYFITDRGPNIRCKDDIKRIKKDLCHSGKIFPTPGYSPRIYKIQLQNNPQTGNVQSYNVLNMIKIRNNNNQVISGMPNDLVVTDRESGYDRFGKSIKLDNEGIDSEALVRLSDGTFWVAEEYAPSLLHINAHGNIIERIVPVTVDNDLKSSNYRVTGKLPMILRKRMLNRGIEGLAVSGDESFLYFILQSPLANPNKAAYKNSNNVRLFKVKLNQGKFSKIVGEYVYKLDTAESFGNIVTGLGDVRLNKQGVLSSFKKHNVKVSELTVLPTGELIVLERISKTTKLYKINLQTASNILGSLYDDETTSPSLEQIQDTNKVGIRPVNKQLVFNSMIDAPNLPRKIEGIASLTNGRLLLINDNDFDGRVAVRASIIKLNVDNLSSNAIKPTALSSLDL